MNHGPLAGLSLFDPEESLGLDLIRVFDNEEPTRQSVHTVRTPNGGDYGADCVSTMSASTTPAGRMSRSLHRARRDARPPGW